MSLLLAILVATVVIMGVSSQVKRTLLRGRNARAHRRALGKLAIITSEEPGRPEAGVGQTQVHVRRLDEVSTVGPHEAQDLAAPSRVAAGLAATAAPAGIADGHPSADWAWMEDFLGTTNSDDVAQWPVAEVTVARKRPRRSRRSGGDDPEVVASGLPTGAVAALGRLGPTSAIGGRGKRRARSRRS